MNRNTRNLQILREKIGVEQFRVIAELLNQEHLTFGDYTRGGFISKEEQREAIMKDFYHGYSWDELERKYRLTPKGVDCKIEVVDGKYNISINADQQQTAVDDSIKDNSMDWLQIIQVVLLVVILICLVRKPKER